MLRGVTIDLPPGTKAALVGPSGGGKVSISASQDMTLAELSNHLHRVHRSCIADTCPFTPGDPLQLH